MPSVCRQPCGQSVCPEADFAGRVDGAGSERRRERGEHCERLGSKDGRSVGRARDWEAMKRRKLSTYTTAREKLESIICFLSGLGNKLALEKRFPLDEFEGIKLPTIMITHQYSPVLGPSTPVAMEGVGAITITAEQGRKTNKTNGRGWIEVPRRGEATVRWPGGRVTSNGKPVRGSASKQKRVQRCALSGFDRDETKSWPPLRINYAYVARTSYIVGEYSANGAGHDSSSAGGRSHP